MAKTSRFSRCPSQTDHPSHPRQPSCEGAERGFG
jgi:hypothetical protein